MRNSKHKFIGVISGLGINSSSYVLVLVNEGHEGLRSATLDRRDSDLIISFNLIAHSILNILFV